MSTIKELYTQSLLAQATYADLTIGLLNTDPQKAALKDKGSMALAEATDFANKWSVAAVFHGLTGADATVFKNIEVGAVNYGKTYLAVRGTELSFTDLVTDANLAIFGIPSFDAQYWELSSQVKTWMTNGTLKSGFTMTGHSLGGYLAGALDGQYDQDGNNLNHVYTYNAPAYGGIIGSLVNILGFINTVPSNSIDNIRGTAGWSAISGLGTPLAPPQLVETEDNGSIGNNHSIINITNSLAIQNEFATLDTAVTPATLNYIMEASGSNAALEQENTLDALRKLFGSKIMTSDASATGEGNHENLWANIIKMEGFTTFKALTGKVTISMVIPTLATARADFSSFLTLEKLTPFVLKTTDATAIAALKNAFSILINPTDPLSNYWAADTTTLKGSDQINYSDNWITDRSYMLSKLVAFNTETLTPVTANGETFIDVQYAVSFSSNTTALAADNTFYMFGSTGNDILTSGNKNDHLYGRDGNDSMTGGAGADYLEGNAGADTLLGGAGNDTLKGGIAADSLNGGTGNDFYYVDNTGDVVTETSTLATELDSVYSSITYILGANLENLTLVGTAAIKCELRANS
jgi:hypothetical protein